VVPEAASLEVLGVASSNTACGKAQDGYAHVIANSLCVLIGASPQRCHGVGANRLIGPRWLMTSTGGSRIGLAFRHTGDGAAAHPSREANRRAERCHIPSRK
jgi:hypothetical protein